MHDEQMNKNDGNRQIVSSNEQRLVEEIGTQWRDAHKLSREDLKHMLLLLPEKYRAMVVHAAAEQFLSTMQLHLLQAVALFYQQAADEGIDATERDETLQDIEADARRLMDLNRRLAVDTPEDLFKLGKITVNAQILSHSNTAEDAQRWLYNLPQIYQSRLEQEHLTKQISGIEHWLHSLSGLYQGSLEHERLTDRSSDGVVNQPEISITIRWKLMPSPAIRAVPSAQNEDKQHIDSLATQIQPDESKQWGKILRFTSGNSAQISGSTMAG